MSKIYQTILISIFVIAPVDLLAANLIISPAGGTYEVGDYITVRAVVSGENPLNAISGSLSFPTSIFSVESVSKVGSILNFWVTEPSFSKSLGTVSFEGVALGGFQGSSGTVVTITLKATKTGSGTVLYQSGQVLANDGQGTDITGNLTGGRFSIIEASIKTKPVVQEKVSEPEPIQPPPSLKAPEILLGSKYDERAIVGTSEYPKAQVLVTFTSMDGVKIFITGSSDLNGEFALPVPKTLKRGDYKVTAVLVKDNGDNSLVSNEIIIKMGNIFSDIALEVKISIILLILTLLYLGVRISLHLKKDRNRDKTIKHEVKDAENVLHKSFEIIKEDLEEVKADKTKINKDINEAEKIINKEIKDIEP